MRNQQENGGRKKGGRPRKFPEPSRPVTVTLPERTLRLLESVDSDRAKAITKATDALTSAAPGSARPVRLVEVEKGVGLIVVGPSALLKSIPWLKLVEISPANYLLALPSGVPIEKLEVAVADIAENVPKAAGREKELLTDLHECLSRLRRENRMCKSEIIFVETGPCANSPALLSRRGR